MNTFVSEWKRLELESEETQGMLALYIVQKHPPSAWHVLFGLMQEGRTVATVGAPFAHKQRAFWLEWNQAESRYEAKRHSAECERLLNGGGY